jgi:hypothetical protein
VLVSLFEMIKILGIDLNYFCNIILSVSLIGIPAMNNITTKVIEG